MLGLSKISHIGFAPAGFAVLCAFEFVVAGFLFLIGFASGAQPDPFLFA